MLVVDTQSAIERLMRLLAVEGVTGREARIGKELIAALKEAGVPARGPSGSTMRTPASRCRPRPATSSSICRVGAHSRGQIGCSS